MSDEVIKIGGTTTFFPGSDCTGVFDNKVAMKHNNLLRKLLDEVTATPGVKVSHVASNRRASLFAVAYRKPGRSPQVDTIYYEYKYRKWVMDNSRISFTREFVRSYLKSVCGMRSVSEVGVVEEIVMFQMPFWYSMSVYGNYTISCVAGGLVLARIAADDYVHVLDFIPYEDIAPKKIKSFYGDVLRYYVSGEGNNATEQDVVNNKDRVSKDLLMELVGLRPVIRENGEISDYERIND